jgi:allantoate deiminase
VDADVVASLARDAVERCRVLATYSEEAGFTTRTFLSPPMRDVHAHLKEWMTKLGMSSSVDPAGNLRGVRPSRSPAAPRLIIGSHLDTVPHAGAFDGVLGVVLGLSLVELLGSDPMPLTIEIAGFSEEEGVRFGVPFIGSRALVGALDAELLDRADAAGVTVAQAIRAFGLDPDRMAEAMARVDVVGYLEFHIEQGPVLDHLDLPLGVVEGIVGQTRGDVRFTGAANHAGTTPMGDRRDAVAAAAEWIVWVERRARLTPGLVATVGCVEPWPGATNVIAGHCACTLDVRHAVDHTRAEALEDILDSAKRAATSRGVTVEWEARLDQPAVPMDRSLLQILAHAVEQCDVPVHRMPSGAGHDAMIMAGRMRAAMLFLRSPAGVSHHPDESVHERDVALALRAGLGFLRALAHPHA